MTGEQPDAREVVEQLAAAERERRTRALFDAAGHPTLPVPPGTPGAGDLDEQEKP